MADQVLQQTVGDSAALQQVLNANEQVVVSFVAEWCERCREVETALENCETATATVDVEAAPMLAYRYNVNSLPTMVRFEAGEPVDRVEGVPGDVDAFVQSG